MASSRRTSTPVTEAITVTMVWLRARAADCRRRAQWRGGGVGWGGGGGSRHVSGWQHRSRRLGCPGATPLCGQLYWALPAGTAGLLTRSRRVRYRQQVAGSGQGMARSAHRQQAGHGDDVAAGLPHILGGLAGAAGAALVAEVGGLLQHTCGAHMASSFLLQRGRLGALAAGHMSKGKQLPAACTAPSSAQLLRPAAPQPDAARAGWGAVQRMTAPAAHQVHHRLLV